MRSRTRPGAVSQQTLIIVVIVLIASVAGYWWFFLRQPVEPSDQPEPLVLPDYTYTTYSAYGFSFDHPEGMIFSDGALLGGFDHARPVSGDIQGVFSNIPESVGVIWFGADEALPLEGFLENLFDTAVELAGFRDLTLGAINSSTKDGYEMLSQPFSVKDAENVEQDGVAGVWFDEEDGRLYCFYLVTLTEVAERLDMDARFHDYVDSFSSPGWEPPSGELEPYWPTAGWRHASPEDVGIDGAMLDEMIEYVKNSEMAADSVLVIRNGYLVSDYYASGLDEDDTHIIYSNTKSVVSTLIGIAIDEGYIDPDLDQRLLDLFPDRTYANPSAWKDEITLRDLLVMSGGFDARDSWLYSWEWLGRMHEAEDAIQYILDLDMAFEPGSRFEYTNGISHLLSCIVTETTGMSALEFAEEHLFGPIGITRADWSADSMGRNWGYSNIYITPHDMAKFGYLFLHGGEWDGEQVVSSEWVEEATTKHIDANIYPGYGYQWWVHPDGYYSGVGYKGQFIHVVPDLDLIMVTTSSNENDFNRILALLEDYVIPAVVD